MTTAGHACRLLPGLDKQAACRLRNKQVREQQARMSAGLGLRRRALTKAEDGLEEGHALRPAGVHGAPPAVVGVPVVEQVAQVDEGGHRGAVVPATAVAAAPARTAPPVMILHCWKLPSVWNPSAWDSLPQWCTLYPQTLGS